MVKYRVGATARAQLVQILIRSAYDYGDRHADNYLLLLETAMEDVASEPGRAGARPVRRFSGGLELRHSLFQEPGAEGSPGPRPMAQAHLHTWS